MSFLFLTETLWRVVIPSPTKQFYIANGKVQNRIQVVPTAKLTFMGRTYNAGSKLAFQLRPYQVVQILSTGALTNTKVISEHRVMITIGYIYKYPGMSTESICLTCINDILSHQFRVGKRGLIHNHTV